MDEKELIKKLEKLECNIEDLNLKIIHIQLGLKALTRRVNIMVKNG